MNRRDLLRSAAIAPLALGGCSFLSSVASTNMTSVASDISIISGAITTVRNLLPSGSTVAALIDDAKAIGAKIVATTTEIAASPLAKALEADLRSALIAGASLLPTSSAGIIKDALTVLSIVKTAVGIVSAVALAPAPGEVDAARLRLLAAAPR